MATDVLPYLIDQLDKLPASAKALDFLIVSFGGDPMVAWRIMSLLRERVDDVSVLVPQSAFSAATLLALGANEIVMHPNSHLGPVDMQIITVSEGRQSHFSTEDISAFLEFVRDQIGITDQQHLRRLFEATCKEVGTLGVGFTARSAKLSVALAEKLLKMHVKSDKDESKIRNIIESLSRQFHSHAYPVSRKEAIEMKLSVNKQRDRVLEELLWSLWLDMERDFQEREPFSPIQELLKSKAAKDLLASVPQLNLPPNAGGPSNFTADMDVVQKTALKIDPIDFRNLDAIMESPRLADECVREGKILASRLPTLDLQWNVLTSFRGWRRTH